MVTAAVAGRLSTLHVATSTSSPTYVLAGEIKSWTFNGSRGFHDVSNNDSGGNREKIAGFGDASITGSVNYIPSGDAGQTILLDARESGAKIAVRARGEVVSASDEWLTLVVLVTDTTVNVDADGEETLDFTLEVSGSSARSAQP